MTCAQGKPGAKRRKQGNREMHDQPEVCLSALSMFRVAAALHSLKTAGYTRLTKFSSIACVRGPGSGSISLPGKASPRCTTAGPARRPWPAVPCWRRTRRNMASHSLHTVVSARWSAVRRLALVIAAGLGRSSCIKRIRAFLRSFRSVQLCRRNIERIEALIRAEVTPCGIHSSLHWNEESCVYTTNKDI